MPVEAAKELQYESSGLLSSFDLLLAGVLLLACCYYLSWQKKKKPIIPFPFSACMDQQYALLLSKGVKKPNVRKQFIADITSVINDLQNAGHEILVSLDANETQGQDSSHGGIRHPLEECTLTDLHCLLGPTSPPASYKYGLDRKIEYMLGTQAVAQRCIFSKHRGLFIDIDLNELMRAVDAITPPPARGLNSEN